MSSVQSSGMDTAVWRDLVSADITKSLLTKRVDDRH